MAYRSILLGSYFTNGYTYLRPWKYWLSICLPQKTELSIATAVSLQLCFPLMMHIVSTVCRKDQSYGSMEVDHTRNIEDSLLTSPNMKPSRAAYDKPSSTSPVVYTADEKYYLYIITAVAAINSCNLGYDQSIIASVGPLLQEQTQFPVSEVELELFVGILDFASLFGAAISNLVADKFGRKGCLRFAAIIFIISVLGMALSNSYAVLLSFRFLTGIGVGLGLSIDPMYISEVAPSDKRGKLISYAELAINIGILFGFGFGAALHGLAKNVGWRVMLGLGAFMPTVLLVCLLYMPETPRWLLANNRKEEAKQVLTDIYDSHTDINEMVEAMSESIAHEEEMIATHGGWDQFYKPKPGLKRAIIAACGMGIIQQLSGIEAMMNYFVFMFEEADLNVNAYMYLVIFGFLKLVTVAIVGPLFDNPDFGRKKMLITSGVGISISMLIFTIVYSPEFADELWRGPLLIAIMLFYVTIFSVGYGPGNWIIIAEVFPTHVRAKGVSLATFSNRVMATIISGSFLSMTHYMTYSGVFAMLFILAVFSVIFICFCIPETQGVSLENMAHAFGETSTHSVRSDGSHPHGEVLSSVSLPSQMTDTTNTTVV